MLDRRVPKWQKAIPLLPFLYILSPFNFLTFTIPIVGTFEDVALMVLAMKLFEQVVDDKIVQAYQPASA